MTTTQEPILTCSPYYADNIWQFLGSLKVRKCTLRGLHRYGSQRYIRGPGPSDWRNIKYYKDVKPPRRSRTIRQLPGMQVTDALATPPRKTVWQLTKLERKAALRKQARRLGKYHQSVKDDAGYWYTA